MNLNLEKIKKKNISFVGLMGSGKSLIGKLLSKELGIKHFDSDACIEKSLKRSINDIFLKDGENYFRKKEKEVVLSLLQNKNCIISLGGGAIIQKSIRDSLKENSYTIYLKTDIETIYERVKFSKKRPLIKSLNIKAKLTNLLKDREQYYNDSDLIINNKNDIDYILIKIKEKLKVT